jgi:hypothetical protein
MNAYCQSSIILLRSGNYDGYAPAMLLLTAVCVSYIPSKPTKSY